jgi:hypothetical protein
LRTKKSLGTVQTKVRGLCGRERNSIPFLKAPLSTLQKHILFCVLPGDRLNKGSASSILVVRDIPDHGGERTQAGPRKAGIDPKLVADQLGLGDWSQSGHAHDRGFGATIGGRQHAGTKPRVDSNQLSSRSTSTSRRLYIHVAYTLFSLGSRSDLWTHGAVMKTGSDFVNGFHR